MWENVLPGLATGLGSALGGLPFDIFNYQQQKDQQEWQRSMFEQAWNREDNAAQRRVADLKAAGLSPVLAAGGAAATSQAPQISAPQMARTNFFDKMTDGIQVATNLMQQKQQIEATDAQIEKTKAETDNLRQTHSLNPEKFDLQKKIAESGITARDIQTAMKNHDFSIFQKLGIPTNSNGQLQQLINAVLLFMKNKEGISNTVSSNARALAEKVAPSASSAYNSLQKYDDWWMKAWEKLIPGITKDSDYHNQPRRGYGGR